MKEKKDTHNEETAEEEPGEVVQSQESSLHFERTVHFTVASED